jgi:hypothetical protein
MLVPVADLQLKIKVFHHCLEIHIFRIRSSGNYHVAQYTLALSGFKSVCSPGALFRVFAVALPILLDRSRRAQQRGS